MAWIRTVAPEDATGSVAKQYKAAIQRVGKVAKIVELHSLDPLAMRQSMALYQCVTTRERSPLDRPTREMIATVVSRANDCFY
jgi:alkylhydroperoxidase family enzyme